MSWSNSRDLLASINEEMAALDDPKGDVRTALKKAQIKVNAFRAAAQVYRMELDHAVRTQRLVTGSPVLPAVRFEDAAAPVLVTVTGARIIKWRADSGMSQKHLAQMVQVAQCDVSNLERGRRPFTFAMLQRLATAMNMPVDDLIHGTAFERGETDDTHQCVTCKHTYCDALPLLMATRRRATAITCAILMDCGAYLARVTLMAEVAP